MLPAEIFTHNFHFYKELTVQSLFKSFRIKGLISFSSVNNCGPDEIYNEYIHICTEIYSKCLDE
jgi:hypothetical protein